jgi:uracil-DNA glycosylase
MHILRRGAAMRSSSSPAGAYFGAVTHCWPSTRSEVHETGIPWNDPSGDRLRHWLCLTSEQFYDPCKIAISPIAFCYPGKAASGDRSPRPKCAPRWHGKLNRHLPDISLTLLIGQNAQVYYLGRRRKATLRDTVLTWKEYWPTIIFHSCILLRVTNHGW